MRASSWGVCLVAALAATTAACTQTVVAVDPSLLDDLVGYWRLNEPAGSTVVHDSSTHANDGTLVSLDPATVWIADGPEGQALSVEGKGHVNVPDSASIDSITSQVTMAAWMYLDGTTTDYATAISRQIGTGYGQHYHLSVNSNMEPALFITTGPDAHQVVLFASPTVPQKTWFHLAATYDGTYERLYLNGVQVDSGLQSGTFVPETNPVILSGNGNTNTVGESVPGRLDDVMLYRRALSAQDITRIYKLALLPPKSAHTDASADRDH